MEGIWQGARNSVFPRKGVKLTTDAKSAGPDGAPYFCDPETFEAGLLDGSIKPSKRPAATNDASEEADTATEDDDGSNAEE